MGFSGNGLRVQDGVLHFQAAQALFRFPIAWRRAKLFAQHVTRCWAPEVMQFFMKVERNTRHQRLGWCLFACLNCLPVCSFLRLFVCLFVCLFFLSFFRGSNSLPYIRVSGNHSYGIIIVTTQPLVEKNAGLQSSHPSESFNGVLNFSSGQNETRCALYPMQGDVKSQSQQ